MGLSTIMQLLEVEEQAGRYWHRLVGDVASYPKYSDCAVRLEDIRVQLGVFFRALGGAPGVALTAGSQHTSTHRLTFLQRLGAAAERMEQARFDGETLMLPIEIDLFPTAALNRDAYFWLTAFFTATSVAAGDVPETGVPDTPLHRDIRRLRRAHDATRTVLGEIPGLRARYRRLCDGVLAARPQRNLPPVEAAVEATVAYMLDAGDPTALLDRLAQETAPRGYRPFLPVPLWGIPSSRREQSRAQSRDDPAAGGEGEGDARRHKAQRKTQDQAQRDDPMILNNMEKILSLAEMVNVNRAIDDDDPDQAKKAADDLDELTLSEHKRRAASKIKLDLDLPPDAIDTTRLKAAVTYPEWDYRSARLMADHCRVITATAEENDDLWKPDGETRRRIRRIARQFEALRPRRETCYRQNDGDELDMDALVRARCDLAARGEGSDRIYTNVRQTTRDLAVAILVDVSLSTDSWVENRRVLDIEKEALSIFAAGLNASRDDNAMYTFTSRRRDYVRISELKGFDEPFGPRVGRRIAGLKPGYYTRMGAAIRHVAKQLEKRENRHRLLLVLTDGKPNDIDHYEGRYGLEDTRMAIREARRAGNAVFGVTIDHKARAYFPFLFGSGSYHIVGHAAKIAQALPKIYAQLVN
ncbi:nitric oxide reductase activation protein NorD [Varunaivibrio sulfuroxidans]|uniref:Nitric oxide reductase NorD protein n=1 Tax=Varunaivibrio sulfuroxidans TaxID=1773489 RepID=A0A4R3JGU8_9PROT|nr:VWA domain-containing protein [Varunaivibrio sulfuroxidans]TCS64715.1 nitric oxide reductase NorD protein [Varunaivibrio sulfuroxidans]WES29979.1 VWA domain-containing protein [Varunaivibrio sulfuroxidans]